MAHKNLYKLTIDELIDYKNNLIDNINQLTYKDKGIEVEIRDFNNVLGNYNVSLNNKQMAIKIDMNSLYGILANRWSRWCNYDIASAITSASSSLIKFIGNYINNYFISLGYKPVLIYIDTDSIYLTLKEIVDEKYDGKRPDNYKIIEKFLDGYFKDTIQPLINEAIKIKLTEMNASDIHEEYEHMKMSREVIGSSGFWKAKKKYAVRVYNNEGVSYDTPDLKIMGLEIIRRTAPKFIKDNMGPVLNIIMDGDQDKLSSFNKEMKEKFYNSDLTDISPVKPANNMKKYWSPDLHFKTGTPSHVRAALRYNQLLEELDLKHKYEPIKEGDKIHVVYLKEPNPTKLKYIAFPLNGSIPCEFGLHQFIDYKTQFEKVYVNQLIEYTDILNWAYSDQKRLDYFFKTNDKSDNFKRRRRIKRK